MPDLPRPPLPRSLPRPSLSIRWAAALCLLAAAAARAQGLPLDEQLAASLAALPAPLVAPRAPQTVVVPAQVRRWREEIGRAHV